MYAGGLALTFRWVVALTFATSVVAKVRSDEGTSAVMAEFGLRARTGALAGGAVILAEASASVMLASGVGGAAGPVLATALLSTFTLAMIAMSLRGTDVACGCFGNWLTERIGLRSIVRNIALVAMAVWSLFPKGAPDDQLGQTLPAAVIASVVVLSYALAVRALGFEAGASESSTGRMVDRWGRSVPTGQAGERVR